jgi:tetratricopeptide (TPR) repeat protein
MDITRFYSQILGLSAPWTVTEVLIGTEPERVDVRLGCDASGSFQCPRCGRHVPSCDLLPERMWRHLDTCGKTTYVHARLPVVDCPEHGKQHLDAPWGHADSPVTGAFEELVATLAGSIGDSRKTARLVRMESSQLRMILRRAAENAKMAADKRLLKAGESASKPPNPPQARQLGLFDRNDMIFVNQAIHALRNLNLDKAIALFQKHRTVFTKGYIVDSLLSAAELLLRGIHGAPADFPARSTYLCRLWDSFEDFVQAAGIDQNSFGVQLKSTFFSRLIEEAEKSMAQGTDPSSFPGDIPFGYMLLQAGRYDDAVRCLQAAIPTMPENAALYGYLGDAYLLRGDPRVARQCYREACFIDPAGMDWRHLKDEELIELKQDLLLEYGLNPDLALSWLPSHARITGIFEHKAMRIHDGMKELVTDYLALRKKAAKKKSPVLSAKLFFRGLILCENKESLKFIKTIDLIDVRAAMKQANPELFAEFLDTLVEDQGTN